MTNTSDSFAGSTPSQYVPDIPTITIDNGIETFNNRLLTTKKALVDHILMMLGYPLISVELTPEQFDCCISNACHIYTKYATFQDRYLCIDLKDYDQVEGLNLKQFNISQVKDLSLVPATQFGITTSELCFGMSGFVSQQGSWHNFSFVSIQAFHEFKELAERMLFPKPDWTFNNITGKLIMYPSPINLMPSFGGAYMVGNNNQPTVGHMPAIATVEIEPPLEELYSNECIKTLTFGYAKMLLGTIRSKFANVSLPGGGTISGEEMRREGQEAVDKGIDMVRQTAAYGNAFVIC